MSTQAATTVDRNEELPLIAALTALHDVATHRGKLASEGPWNLARKEARQLTAHCDGATPAGGWRSLAGLATGIGVLDAREAFFAAGSIDPAEHFDDVDEAHIAAAEAFFHHLIPPAVAAGLFLSLDVHPLWGLRLARALHLRSDLPVAQRAEGWTDEDLLPAQDLHTLADVINAFLADVLALLQESSTTNFDGLSAAFCDLSDDRYGQLADQQSGNGLDLVLDDRMTSGNRSAAFFARELVEHVLTPARIIHTTNDTLHVNTALLACLTPSIGMTDDTNAEA